MYYLLYLQKALKLENFEKGLTLLPPSVPLSSPPPLLMPPLSFIYRMFPAQSCLFVGLVDRTYLPRYLKTG